MIPSTKVLPVDGGKADGGVDCLGLLMCLGASGMGNGMVGGLEWV